MIICVKYSFNNKINFTIDDVITIESPTFAESIKEGDIRFEKKVGDHVKQDELIAKIETDKTAMEIHAPKAGIIEELLVEEGASVTANLPILKLKVVQGGAQPAAAAATPAPAAPKPAPQAASPPPPPPQPQQPAKSVLASPPPLPKEPVSSIPISQIPITPFVPTSSQPVDINKIGGSRVETRVKMSKMRQTVASRLKQAQNTCAMLTTFNEINMA